MRVLRRWEVRAHNLHTGITNHWSWHTSERTAKRAALYWMDRAYSNDGAREDTGMRFYVREVEK